LAVKTISVFPREAVEVVEADFISVGMLTGVGMVRVPGTED
jgi:hypothetical protein